VLSELLLTVGDAIIVLIFPVSPSLLQIIGIIWGFYNVFLGLGFTRAIRVIRIIRDLRVTRLLNVWLLLLLVALYHCNSRSLPAQRLHECNIRKSPALARVYLVRPV
jgi:hypothetical protein